MWNRMLMGILLPKKAKKQVSLWAAKQAQK
jgi:hypothetical protein